MATIFSAVAYSNVAVSRKIYNEEDLRHQEAVSIELPECVASEGNYILKEIKCTDKEEYLPITPQRIIRKWIDIGVDHLDLSVGTHTYRLVMTHTFYPEFMTLYFTYTIQSDNPEKPYIYMKREEGN